LVGPFSAHIRLGQAVQFRVHQRQQVLHRLWVTPHLALSNCVAWPLLFSADTF
jgi:hypothetical protein